MKYTSLVLLAFMLISILYLSSCRCMNRIGQDSQPDASTTQQQGSIDTSAGTSTAEKLKVDLRLVKGVIGEDGVDITVEQSVNQKARLSLSVRYPDGSVKDSHTDHIFDAGKHQTVIHVDPNKGKGQGAIKLMAEALNGDKEGASINYVITSYTPNTNVLWGDYQQILPSH
jgi:predicted small secreted protein